MARGVPKSMARMTGRWRIVAMSGWGRDAIDLVEPGFIEFSEDETIEGHLFFHLGDDSTFRGRTFTPADELDGP